MTPDWDGSKEDVMDTEPDQTVIQSVSGSYQPSYAGIGDVPLSGPGADADQSENDYDETQKRKALFYAESKVELDFNDGDALVEPTKHHRNAVMNLASHILTAAAEEPDDVSIGDMVGEGGSLVRYSSTYLENYKSLRRSIRESTVEDGGVDNYTTTVNNRTPSGPPNLNHL
jgi:hypothetical protein